MPSSGRRGMIRDLLLGGKTRREVFAQLRHLVLDQIKPFVFSENTGGSRMPLPVSEQLIRLWHEIGRVSAMLGHVEREEFDPNQVPTGEDEIPNEGGYDDDFESPDEDEDEIETESPESENETSETERPVKASKSRIRNDIARFVREVRRIRKFCIERDASDPIDSISMRPIEAGAKLIPAGIPGEALIDAMTMHWPDDVRRSARIDSFDYESLSARILSERGISEIVRSNGRIEKPHKLFGYVLVLLENRQPVMAIGPMGTGKSHLAKQAADFLSVPYAETPMSPGATRGDLLGRHTIGGLDRAVALAAIARNENGENPETIEQLSSIISGNGGGFIAAEFSEIYGSGGIFNFEEIDAADPGMLLVLNNALAGDALYNSMSGEMIPRSDGFMAFSTANTTGLGANRQYGARERLDGATIDRWRMGRVTISLDENVEDSIAFRHV